MLARKLKLEIRTRSVGVAQQGQMLGDKTEWELSERKVPGVGADLQK